MYYLVQTGDRTVFSVNSRPILSFLNVCDANELRLTCKEALEACKEKKWKGENVPCENIFQFLQCYPLATSIYIARHLNDQNNGKQIENNIISLKVSIKAIQCLQKMSLDKIERVEIVFDNYQNYTESLVFSVVLKLKIASDLLLKKVLSSSRKVLIVNFNYCVVFTQDVEQIFKTFLQYSERNGVIVFFKRKRYLEQQIVDEDQEPYKTKIILDRDEDDIDM
jgi:hypothetical protein